MVVSGCGPSENGPATDSKNASQTPAPPAEPPPPPPDELVPVWTPAHYPFLPDEDPTQTISLGNVTEGRLQNGVMLPLPSQTYEVLPKQLERGFLYGTPELVGLIEHTAERLHQTHQRRLHVGHLSRRGGGDIRFSVSHNAGRDADLAFCYQTRGGEPFTRLRDLIPVDRKGVSKWKGGHRFDAACTWTIVKALLEYKGAQLQYLFISAPMKKKLLAHAKEAKEPPELIQRADSLLWQPGKSAPHNDHLHVRIHCSKKDTAMGCAEQGRALPATTLYPEARQDAIVALAGGLSADPTPSAAHLQATMERLTLLGAKEHLEAIAAHLAHPEPQVRRAVIDAVVGLGGPEQAQLLTERVSAEPDGVLKGALLDALAQLGGGDVGPLLAKLIADPASAKAHVGPIPEHVRVTYTMAPPADPRYPEKDLARRKRGKKPMSPVARPGFRGHQLPLDDRPWTLQMAAVEAAAACECTEPVPALLPLITSKDRLTRDRAARALRRLTNHSARIGWTNPELTDKAHQRAIKSWNQWYEANKAKDRDTWLAVGFQSRGFKVKEVGKRHIWELVRAVAAPDHLSYNAQRALMRLSNHRPASLTWNKPAARRHWARWLNRRRGQLGLRKAPKSLLK